ncbi:unnamed protein product [Chrysoparadoxa australica]
MTAWAAQQASRRGVFCMVFLDGSQQVLVTYNAHPTLRRLVGEAFMKALSWGSLLRCTLQSVVASKLGHSIYHPLRQSVYLSHDKCQEWYFTRQNLERLASHSLDGSAVMMSQGPRQLRARNHSSSPERRSGKDRGQEVSGGADEGGRDSKGALGLGGRGRSSVAGGGGGRGGGGGGAMAAMAAARDRARSGMKGVRRAPLFPPSPVDTKSGATATPTTTAAAGPAGATGVSPAAGGVGMSQAQRTPTPHRRPDPAALSHREREAAAAFRQAFRNLSPIIWRRHASMLKWGGRDYGSLLEVQGKVEGLLKKQDQRLGRKESQSEVASKGEGERGGAASEKCATLEDWMWKKQVMQRWGGSGMLRGEAKVQEGKEDAAGNNKGSNAGAAGSISDRMEREDLQKVYSSSVLRHSHTVPLLLSLASSSSSASASASIKRDYLSVPEAGRSRSPSAERARKRTETAVSSIELADDRDAVGDAGGPVRARALTNSSALLELFDDFEGKQEGTAPVFTRRDHKTVKKRPSLGMLTADLTRQQEPQLEEQRQARSSFPHNERRSTGFGRDERELRRESKSRDASVTRDAAGSLSSSGVEKGPPTPGLHEDILRKLKRTRSTFEGSMIKAFGVRTRSDNAIGISGASGAVDGDWISQERQNQLLGVTAASWEFLEYYTRHLAGLGFTRIAMDGWEPEPSTVSTSSSSYVDTLATLAVMLLRASIPFADTVVILEVKVLIDLAMELPHERKILAQNRLFTADLPGPHRSVSSNTKTTCSHGQLLPTVPSFRWELLPGFHYQLPMFIEETVQRLQLSACSIDFALHQARQGLFQHPIQHEAPLLPARLQQMESLYCPRSTPSFSVGAGVGETERGGHCGEFSLTGKQLTLQRSIMLNQEVALLDNLAQNAERFGLIRYPFEHGEFPALVGAVMLSAEEGCVRGSLEVCTFFMTGAYGADNAPHIVAYLIIGATEGYQSSFPFKAPPVAEIALQAVKVLTKVLMNAEVYQEHHLIQTKFDDAIQRRYELEDDALSSLIELSRRIPITEFDPELCYMLSKDVGIDWSGWIDHLKRRSEDVQLAPSGLGVLQFPHGAGGSDGQITIMKQLPSFDSKTSLANQNQPSSSSVLLMLEMGRQSQVLGIHVLLQYGEEWENEGGQAAREAVSAFVNEVLEWCLSGQLSV